MRLYKILTKTLIQEVARVHRCVGNYGWSVLYFSIFKILNKDTRLPDNFVVNIYLLYNLEWNTERGHRI